MTRSLLIANALLAASLMPAAALAQTKVSSDSRHTTNFTQVRSFAVQPGELSDNELVNERILNAIAGSLASRGMTQSPEHPDVYVIPRLTSEIRQEVTSYGPGWYEPYGAFGVSKWYGPYGWDRWGGPSYTIRDIRYDTLTIDVVDAKTGSLLWRGRGIRSVSPHWDSHEVDEKVRKTVAKIFKNYPYGDDN
jgi:hypothetical protein